MKIIKHCKVNTIGALSLFLMPGLVFAFDCSDLDTDVYHRTNKLKFISKGQSNSSYINKVGAGKDSLCGPTSLAHIYGGMAKSYPYNALNTSGPAYNASRTTDWVPDLDKFSKSAKYFAKKLATNATYEFNFAGKKWFEVETAGTWRIDLFAPTIMSGLKDSFYSYGDGSTKFGYSNVTWPQRVKMSDFTSPICDSVKREGRSTSSTEYDFHNTQFWVSYGHYRVKKDTVDLCFGLFSFCEIGADSISRNSGHFVAFTGAKRTSKGKEYILVSNPKGSSEGKDSDGIYGVTFGDISFSVAGFKLMDKMATIPEPEDEKGELHIIETYSKIYMKHGKDCGSKSMVMDGSNRGKCK